jgi:hypothetical protein
MTGESVTTEKGFNRYTSELGLFIHEFARAEKLLQQLLRKCARVTDEVGWAVFSGARVDAARDFINRILEAEGNTWRAERLKPSFDQLTAISTIRNNILHWGVQKIDDFEPNFRVTNEHLTPGPRGKREYLISPDDLRSMSLDLVRISAYLTLEIHGGPVNQGAWEMMREHVDGSLGASWQYKPPQQAAPPNRRASPASRKSGGRPPDASGG